MASVVIEVDLSDLRKRLEHARDVDLSPAFAIIAEDLRTAVTDRWESGGDGEWPPLSPAYAKRKRGGAGKILIDTGRALGGVHATSGPDWAAASTDAEYMRYHLDGGPIMPKRNPFEVKIDFDEIESTIADEYERALGAG